MGSGLRKGRNFFKYMKELVCKMTTRAIEGLHGCERIAKIFWISDLFILKDITFAATKRDAKL